MLAGDNVPTYRGYFAGNATVYLDVAIGSLDVSANITVDINITVGSLDASSNIPIDGGVAASSLKRANISSDWNSVAAVYFDFLSLARDFNVDFLLRNTIAIKALFSINDDSVVFNTDTVAILGCENFSVYLYRYHVLNARLVQPIFSAFLRGSLKLVYWLYTIIVKKSSVIRWKTR